MSGALGKQHRRRWQPSPESTGLTAAPANPAGRSETRPGGPACEDARVLQFPRTKSAQCPIDASPCVRRAGHCPVRSRATRSCSTDSGVVGGGKEEGFTANVYALFLVLIHIKTLNNHLACKALRDYIVIQGFTNKIGLT